MKSGFPRKYKTPIKDRKTIAIRITPKLHARLLRYVDKQPAQVGAHKQDEPDRRSIQGVVETAIKEYLRSHRS